MPRPYDMVTGTYTGTGSAVDVTVGFKPRYIRAWNVTDGDENWEFINGMSDATALRVVDSGSGTTDLSLLGSNGCTLADRGFSAGSSLSESGKTYRYIALP